MKKYISYEEGIKGNYTHEEIETLYKEQVNKEEYSTFEDWLFDMLKSGAFEEKQNISCIKDNDCWDSADFLEEYSGYRPCEDVSLAKFEKILEQNDVCLWNYPLTEIDHIIENNIDVVLVRFPEYMGGYEYRFCEIPKED